MLGCTRSTCVWSTHTSRAQGSQLRTWPTDGTNGQQQEPTCDAVEGPARPHATFTQGHSVMGPPLKTHRELCGGSGSACVNTAAPHATFLCNPQFLSASPLPAPLGIASLMNANGKSLIQLKSMNNGGAW